ncbi:MAG: hypothetical protein ACO1RX_08375 [Candidatus Sericytochromatia bacterium]
MSAFKGLISLSAARQKLAQLAENLSRPARDRLFQILSGSAPLAARDSFYDQHAPEYMLWIENRLAAPHLGYLAADQVNGLWGQSTTEALALLARVYGLPFQGVLDQALLQALLDGQKSPQQITSKPNSYQWLRQGVQQAGHSWQDAPQQINLIGLRGYVVPTGQVQNLPDIYNDSLFVAWRNAQGEQVQAFLASTDPGRYYYQIRHLNPLGCAWLNPGQYAYKKGIHGYYPALVQAGPVSVTRIGKTGLPRPENVQQSGWFGIHIHAGSGGSSIYNASAGCQVIQSAGPQGWQWQRFWQLIHGAQQSVFNYTLLDGKGFVA